MSRTVITAEHAGIHRVVSGVQALLRMVSDGTSGTRVYEMLTLAAVVFAVTLTSRALDASALGFMAEALALGVAGFVAFSLMVTLVVPALRRVGALFNRWRTRRAYVRAEEQFWLTALRDPRVMAEYLAARTRAEDMQASAPSPAWYVFVRYW